METHITLTVFTWCSFLASNPTASMSLYFSMYSPCLAMSVAKISSIIPCIVYQKDIDIVGLLPGWGVLVVSVSSPEQRARCIGGCDLGGVCNHIKAFGPAQFSHKKKNQYRKHIVPISLKYAGENTECYQELIQKFLKEGAITVCVLIKCKI